MVKITAGATDQTIDVFVQDSSSATGEGLAGLVYNTASLICYYRRGPTGAATQLSLATQTVGGVHSDGGFVEIHATNQKGLYRLDLSDAIVAAGVGSVSLMLSGAANMAPTIVRIELDTIKTTAEGIQSDLDNGTDGLGALKTLIDAVPTASENAVAIEAAILNEGDATALLAAIAAKVEEFLINEGDATATLTAIAAAVNFAVVSGTVGTQVANLHANQGNWLTATGFATSGALATAQAAIDNVKAVTDQFVFTVIGQVDANAITGGGGTTVNITSSTTVIESQ